MPTSSFHVQVILLSLLLISSAPASARTQNHEGDALPAAQSLIDRHVEVTGGRAAYEAVDRCKSTGALIQENGNEIPMAIHERSPSHRHIALDLATPMTWVTDGLIAWTTTGETSEQRPVDEERQFARRAAFDPFLNWERCFDTIETVGIEGVNGTLAYRVRFSTDDCEDTYHYFGIDSGRLLRTDQTVIYGGIPTPTRMITEEYGEFDGIFLPTRQHRTIYQQNRQTVQIYRIDTVEHNVDFPDGLFDVPEGMTARIEQIDDSLPLAQELIERHIEAVGGRESLSSIVSRKLVGTFKQQRNGQTSPITEFTSAPGNRNTRIDLPGGIRQWIVNEDFAWTLTGGLFEVSGGAQARQSHLRAAFEPHLRWRDLYRSARTVSLETVSDVEAYKVRLTSRDCEEYFQYFDANSGRMIMSEDNIRYAARLIPSRMHYSNYQQFDGVWIPMTIRRELLYGGTPDVQVYEFSEVEHNIEIPPETFQTPAQLKHKPIPKA